MKFRLPEGCGDRGEAIESILGSERKIAERNLSSARLAVKKILIEAKGYSVNEIEIDAEFDTSVGSGTSTSKVDFVVSLNGKRLMSLKCSGDSLVSRERHALACARLLDSYQVPIAVITDGVEAIVLDTVSGGTIGEGVDAIPSRDDLLLFASRAEFIGLPANRVEKEKRIVLAFDAIGCTPEQRLSTRDHD